MSIAILQDLGISKPNPLSLAPECHFKESPVSPAEELLKTSPRVQGRGVKVRSWGGRPLQTNLSASCHSGPP